ncbi:MAG: DUF455 family protein, partial [Bdellovibrionota bacterium]
MSARDWAPFQTVETGKYPDRTRSIDTPEGVADRIRAAAFAEIQAREAFLWAASQFEDASEDLRQAWRILARAEQKHLDWLLQRLSELGYTPSERLVSDQLWHSLTSCKTARDFALFMANAEERGRQAG